MAGVMAKLGKAVKGKSKKKKKGGKGAGDGKENALLKKVAEMEQADYQRKMAQQARAMLKTQLNKEMTMSKVNAKKVKNGWLKIMRLAAVDSLRRDVEVISQNHERDVDRRDALLQMLDRDIDEAEEQFQMALREHLRNMDKLISLQDTRLATLESKFEDDLAILHNEFKTERERITARHGDDRKQLLNLLEAVAQQEAYKAAEAKQEFEQTREEVRNKHIEEINVLSATLDQHIDELERHFESAHLNYLQNTDKRTEEFKKLTKGDSKAARSIELKIRQIERLQASLSTWKNKMVQNYHEFGERNKALEAEKAAMAQHVSQLKARMSRVRNGASKRLVNLSKDVRAAKEQLQERLDLATRLLQLAEKARSLETDKEKVQPYYASSMPETQDPDEVKKTPAEEAAEESKWMRNMLANDGYSEVTSKAIMEVGDPALMRQLDNFYKKYNQVLLSKLATERERDRLREENEQMQSILKQFLEGISITENTVRGANPLLVVNGASNTLPMPVREGGTIPVIESHHMVGTNRIGGPPL